MIHQASGNRPPLASMTGIVKSFDGQRVLHGVDFDLRAGEVHVLAGENGAGKSTLIKILGGVHRPDDGEIRINGRLVRFRSPREAAAGGVAIIHQELSLIPAMSVADNLLLGREPSRLGWVRPRRRDADCAAALERLGLRLDPHQPVADLPISTRQMIEIARALDSDAFVLVMDEPTSALTDVEVRLLFERIALLKTRGCGVIYITHKLEEIHRIANRITVLRDGRRIVTEAAANLAPAEVIRHMVGRTLAQYADDDAPTPYRAATSAPDGTSTSAPDGASTSADDDAPVLLSLADVSVAGRRRGDRPRVDRVSFEVKGGEIVGLGGLQGSGASELLMALFGGYGPGGPVSDRSFGRAVTGHIKLTGRPYRPTSPRRAVACGMALVTNDRQRTGLVMGLSLAANATLACVPAVSPGGWLSARRETRLAAGNARALRLQAASLHQPVATLSGGNQQKVVLAKWINTRPRVILLDEPTRGVDIGAKQEIYQLIRQWRAAGHAIILITSEMPELLMLSDRILVMHRGSVTARLRRDQATPERILHAAMGASDLGA